MTQTHKASRFNIAVPIDGDSDVFLVNTATAALLRVDADTFTELRPLFGDGTRGLPRDFAPAVPEQLDEEIAQALLDGGFVVPHGLDELTVLRDAFERERYSRNAAFTIGLTMACNFACPYCFEEHRPDHMDRATADAVCTFIEEKMDSNQLESIFVNWFGGEPLLNLDVLLHLAKRLRAATEQRGVRLDTLVITNGALLTREVAEQLVAAGVREVQVTIDGPREIHDQRRPLKGGKPSFDRILENLRSVFGLLKVRIRVNVDHGNLPHTPELLQLFLAEGFLEGPHAFEVYPGKITRYTEQVSMVSRPLQQHEILEMVAAFNRGRSAVGMQLPVDKPRLLAGTSRAGCTAMNKSAFVIGPLGHLFKCGLGIDDVREAVGRVGDGAAAAASTARRRLPLVRGDVGSHAPAWDSYNPFNNAKCSGCQFVPVCKGGCPHKVMAGNEAFMNETCEFWDKNFATLVDELARSES